MNVIFIILILIIIYLWFIKYWLAPKQKLRPADVIIVPTGDMFTRCNQAIDIFKKGYADKILFSGKTGSKNTFSLKEKAVKAGISSQNIIIEEQSTNSLENAKYTKEILVKSNFKTIILVSSPYSQRRQYMTFKKVLQGTGIKIINYPVQNYNWLIKTPGKIKYRWQYLIKEPYYIIKYWLRGDIR